MVLKPGGENFKYWYDHRQDNVARSISIKSPGRSGPPYLENPMTRKKGTGEVSEFC